METEFKDIDEKYELEIGKIVDSINKEKAKKILLQFPEGLKPYSQSICDKIEDEINCECFIWMGSCFGACDVPVEISKLGVDMIVQFGHSAWNYSDKKDVKVLR